MRVWLKRPFTALEAQNKTGSSKRTATYLSRSSLSRSRSKASLRRPSTSNSSHPEPPTSFPLLRVDSTAQHADNKDNRRRYPLPPPSGAQKVSLWTRRRWSDDSLEILIPRVPPEVARRAPSQRKKWNSRGEQARGGIGGASGGGGGGIRKQVDIMVVEEALQELGARPKLERLGSEWEGPQSFARVPR